MVLIKRFARSRNSRPVRWAPSFLVEPNKGLVWHTVEPDYLKVFHVLRFYYTRVAVITDCRRFTFDPWSLSGLRILITRLAIYQCCNLRRCKTLWSARKLAPMALSAEQARHTENVFHIALRLAEETNIVSYTSRVSQHANYLFHSVV